MANSADRRLADAMVEIVEAMGPGAQRVDEIVIPALGEAGAFVLGFLVGKLVDKIGAETTDATLLLLIATIERRRVAVAVADGGGI